MKSHYKFKKYSKKYIIKFPEKEWNILNNLRIIKVKGPLGELTYSFKQTYISDQIFILKNELNCLHSKIQKLIHNVTYGCYKILNLNGLGYKSFLVEDKIALDIGYSNLITYKPSSFIILKNFKNKIVLFSIWEQHLNEIVNELQQYAKPDIYKGKGLIIKDQKIELKKKRKK